MFCSKCGEKLEDTAKFCQKCGASKQLVTRATPEDEEKTSPLISHEEVVFYSEDWNHRKSISIATPYFDLMVDKEYLYLIKLGQYYWSTLGLIVGLCVLSILGAFIGYYFGNKNDMRKRDLLRALWIDLNHKLISRDYEGYTLLKIPRGQVDSCVTFEKHKVIVVSNGQKFIFAKSKAEANRLKLFLASHTL